MQVQVLTNLPSFQFGNYELCTYCGAQATSVDHVIPISYQNYYKIHGCRYGPTTRACLFCNSKLSNNYFSCFWERCEYVNHYWERLTRPMEWHDWQLDRLDYTVRTYVVADQEKRKLNRTRADWFQSRDFLLNIEALTWQPVLKYGEATYHKPLAEYFDHTVRILKALIYHDSD